MVSKKEEKQMSSAKPRPSYGKPDDQTWNPFNISERTTWLIVLSPSIFTGLLMTWHWYSLGGLSADGNVGDAKRRLGGWTWGNDPECSPRFQSERAKLWAETRHTVMHFEVGGVDVGQFKLRRLRNQTAITDEGVVQAEIQAQAHVHTDAAEPFHLYEDFDIADMISGNENWQELISYRRLLRHPSLSFYVDKVARKRWLPTSGFVQPRLFALQYGHEIDGFQGVEGNDEDNSEAVLRLLPEEGHFVAKPSHMSKTQGVWLVSRNATVGTTHFSDDASELTRRDNFDVGHVADSLAMDLLFAEDEREESWILRQVKPGIVVEELFRDVFNKNAPPLEFNILTIWGRVWIAQMNYVEGHERLVLDFVRRDGFTILSGGTEALPKWLDWSHLVQTAERLGAHKDMFQVDVFVGVPASANLPDEATIEERLTKVQYVVSESEIHPTTTFEGMDLETCEEGARLWIAGYKMGNYRLVPNKEVPSVFIEHGTCSDSLCTA